MWVLQLNDMRAGNIERGDCFFARADSKEALERLYNEEKVEPYTDGGWGKTFRQGGPLEWANDMVCNAPTSDDEFKFLELPSREEYVTAQAQIAEETYDRDVMSLPEIS
jgi:hypothetical protein